VLAEVRVTGGHAFYDFEAKYLDNTSEYDVPARLPDDPPTST
jgi:D-alanine-D-alanine ligase